MRNGSLRSVDITIRQPSVLAHSIRLELHSIRGHQTGPDIIYIITPNNIFISKRRIFVKPFFIGAMHGFINQNITILKLKLYSSRSLWFKSLRSQEDIGSYTWNRSDNSEHYTAVMIRIVRSNGSSSSSSSSNNTSSSSRCSSSSCRF